MTKQNLREIIKILFWIVFSNNTSSMVNIGFLMIRKQKRLLIMRNSIDFLSYEPGSQASKHGIFLLKSSISPYPPKVHRAPKRHEFLWQLSAIKITFKKISDALFFCLHKEIRLKSQRTQHFLPFFSQNDKCSHNNGENYYSSQQNKIWR